MFNLEYAVKLRHREIILNKEADLLVREALAAQPPRQPLYKRTAAALGRRMIAWGEALEARYEQATHMPAEVTLRESVAHE